MKSLQSKTLGFTIFWLTLVLYSIISFMVIKAELSYMAVIIDTAGLVSSMYMGGQKYLDFKDINYDVNKARINSRTFIIAAFWSLMIIISIAAMMYVGKDMPSLGKIIAFAGANTVIYLGAQKAIDQKKIKIKVDE